LLGFGHIGGGIYDEGNVFQDFILLLTSMTERVRQNVTGSSGSVT
jgi:hypothetical protein